MKNLMRYFYLMLAVSTLFLTSCKDDSVDEVKHFDILKDYMLTNNLDIPNIIGDKAAGTFFVTAAPATEADIADWAAGFNIFDVRSSADYAAGHIVGAQNVAYADILTEANKLGKDAKILLVCYSGQSACYATSLLRIAGFPKAKALKWGMSSWNETYANHQFGWNNGTGNIAEGHSNWTTDAAPANIAFDYPSISANSTDGASILQERVAAVLAAGFKGIPGETVLNNPEDYHINNFFSEAHYTGYGHIDGAFRIQPLTVGGDEIKYLDNGKEVVTYCYTGQTSAIITAYLNVLGYNAKSLKNGVNSLYNSHSIWTANQWGGDSNPKNFPTVQ